MNEARAALNEAWAGLQAEGLDAQIVGSRYAVDTGTITYRYTWHLPKNRTWTYDGQLNMVRDEGRWEVRWSATGLAMRTCSKRSRTAVKPSCGTSSRSTGRPSRSDAAAIRRRL